MKESCKTCKYGYATENEHSAPNIVCRRFPPTVMPDTRLQTFDARESKPDSKTPVLIGKCIWPDIEDDDWCGEWAKK